MTADPILALALVGISIEITRRGARYVAAYPRPDHLRPVLPPRPIEPRSNVRIRRRPFDWTLDPDLGPDATEAGPEGPTPRHAFTSEPPAP
jgi:hypothetical protein